MDCVKRRYELFIQSQNICLKELKRVVLLWLNIDSDHFETGLAVPSCSSSRATKEIKKTRFPFHGHFGLRLPVALI